MKLNLNFVIGSDEICRCGLSDVKSYEVCCSPYHNGIVQPETSMRV